jgi:hypothetical protein
MNSHSSARRDGAANPGQARRREHKGNGQRRDSTPKPYRVLFRRHAGPFSEYQRYASRQEAERVVVLLRWAGAVAIVERVGSER